MNRIILCVVALLLTAGWNAVRAETQQAPLYMTTSFSNLAKSYWLFSNLNPDNNVLIDQYLKITECNLYNQFYSNDTEWNKIRIATRNYIVANKASFPTRFEFVQPIYLEQYDFDAGEFPIREIFRINHVSKMQISGNDKNDYSCLDTEYSVSDFPPNALLNLGRPFTYTSVKANKDLVDEYTQYLKNNKIDIHRGRPAYIRYRVKIEQSTDPIKIDNQIFSNFYGRLESVTVFGDRGMFIKFEDVEL